MPNLIAEEIAGLRITNFIFHVVHHGQPEPILLDKAPIGDFEPFFLARIADTLKGNRYVFEGESLTRKGLADIAADEDRFIGVSKDFAIRFHAADQRIKKGVLILIGLETGGRKLHSLIKYDHEKVIAFVLKDAAAVLRDVVNSFTESPTALQKSALIELTADGGELAVVDRIKRVGISDFFGTFLGVKRRHSETEMTKETLAAVVKVVNEHRHELPHEITGSVRPKIAQIVAQRKSFDADQFFADFFGVHGTQKIRDAFDGEMMRRNVMGEAFVFDEAALPNKGSRTFLTDEGIKLIVPDKARDTVKHNTGPDGWTTVTIRTKSVAEQ